MFRRKDKVAAHAISQRHNAPPQVSAAASSAAKLAVLNNQKSSSSLAAAAAGTALKQNPHPPTDVGNIQTKRLIRRDSNGSSTGSPRPGMERRPSLTERSLRSPSPGREQVVRSPANAPPVPAMPAGVERTPSGRHRAASVEAQRRMMSPPPKQSGGRGMSLDRAGRSDTPPASILVKAPPKLPLPQEIEPPSQRSSVNFSRPMSPAPASPISPTSSSSGGTGWFAGAVVSNGQPRQTLESLEPSQPILTTSELTGIQSGLQGIADQPVKKKKKKKKASAGGNEGARLSEGTMHLTGTAVEQTRADLAAAPASPTTSALGRSSIESDRSFNSVEQVDQPKTRIGQGLVRQPSMIDEAPEYDQTPERANTGRKVGTLPLAKSLDASRVGMTTPEPAPALRAASSTTPDYGQPNGSAVQRNTSLSPSRSARFNSKPDFLGGLQHQPLGRAASPAKSALKHSPSNSVRTASPDVRFSAPASEVGDFGSSLTKKRSNRVSFDETPVIHTGLQNSKYATEEPVAANDFSNDLEDIMKPRAALPTFGSVRNKKETSPPAAHLPRSKTGQAHGHYTGHANDAVVGGILAQDFASKGTPQPAQHEGNMPLAPEVTSVEGTGYASDSESEYSEYPSHVNTPQPEQLNALEQPETTAEAVTSFQTHDSVSQEREQNDAARTRSDDSPPGGMEDSGYVSAVGSTVFGSRPYTSPPIIAVQPATPAAEEPNLHIPGSFPGGWDDEIEVQPTPVHAKSATPAAVPQVQAQPLRAESSRLTSGTLASLRADDHSDTESDTSSIWSDAEEDFPSGPGGFASLDAIVDSTPKPAIPGLVLSKHAPSASTEGQPPSPVAAQWDQATAYWRGLSEQKKRDLEQAALRKEQGLDEESSEGETEESSEEDEGDEGVRTIMKPAKQPAQPSTPLKQQPRQQPKLESPIAFTTTNTAPIAASTVKKEPKLRSSMRQSQVSDSEAPPTRMKKSMRSGTAPQQSTPVAQPRASGEHHFRSSMRGAAPPRPDPVRRNSSGLDESRYAAPQRAAPPAVQNGRPRAASTASGAPRSALKKSNAQPAPVQAAPTLRRQKSDDSVSSFRRERASSRGGMSMRSSMRGAPVPARQVEQRPQSPPEKADKRTRGFLSRMRSVSPAARESEPAHMRSSMRPGSSAGPPPARAIKQEQPQPEPKPPKASRFKSPTRLGFGRKPKYAPESPQSSPRAVTPVAAPVAALPNYKSRLSADSDDEELAPTKFVSRFADSDDDEPSSPQTTKLAPVRGIPRKEDEDDSTDLEDSDHERANTIPPVPTLRDIEQAHGKKPTTMTNGHKKTASILSTGSLRTGKTGAEASGLNASRFANVDRIGPIPEPVSAQTPTSPMERPNQKRRLSWLGMGKGSTRASSMPPPSLASPPSSPAQAKPNLLRRSTPTGLPTLTEDWPLSTPTGEDMRPSTADGPGNALRAGSLRNRPDVGKRRSTADYPINKSGIGGVDEEGSVVGGERKKVGFNFEGGEPVFSARTGKKKKFGGLRKMFGLHD